MTDAELDRLVERLRDLRPMPWDDDIAIAGEQAAAAITALRARIAELEARLEIDPAYPYDGIAVRDALIAALEKDRAEWVEAERVRMGK